MKKLYLLVATTVLGTGIVHSSSPTTFLGPTARLGFTSTFSDVSAYSVAGEAGPKNFRAGATVAMKFSDATRFKLSGEWLWQKINYNFTFNDDTGGWVNQGAVGADLQYLLNGYDFRPAFDLNGYYSYSPSRDFSTQVIRDTFLPLDILRETRHVSGANAYGVNPGLSIVPWMGGQLSVILNYDHVKYRDTYYYYSTEATGFGGTIKVDQLIFANFDIGLAAAIRKPFNNYQAKLGFVTSAYSGVLRSAVFGAYTDGKDGLPNTWNVGLSVDYLLDQRCPVTVPGNLKGEMTVVPADDFLAWTADPAVYMPQVLAVADPRYSLTCPVLPAVVGTIPAQVVPFGAPVTVATAQAFTPGTGLFYTVSATPAPGLNTVTINSTTGAVTLTSSPDGGATTVTVTAANSCGIATLSFPVTFNGD